MFFGNIKKGRGVFEEMFKVGDMAVYPAHGVGVIESIESREIMGCMQSFYVMKILGNNMKIMIPKNGARSVGLRTLITREEIPRVYEILSERNITVDKQTWNKRYKEYWEKIGRASSRERV